MRLATTLTILFLAITSFIHSVQIRDLRAELAEVRPINTTQYGPVDPPDK